MAKKSIQNKVAAKTVATKKADEKLVVVIDNTDKAVLKARKQDLKEREKAVEHAMASFSQSAWLIGENLRAIDDGKLYEAEGFKNFTEYLSSKTSWDMSRTTAYNYIALSKKFTVKEAAEYGHRILYLIARVKDEKISSKLTDMVKSGKDYETIRTTKAKLLKQKGIKQPPGREPRQPSTRKIKIRKGTQTIDGKTMPSTVEVEVEREDQTMKKTVDFIEAPKDSERYKAGYEYYISTSIKNGPKLKVWINWEAETCIVETSN